MNNWSQLVNDVLCNSVSLKFFPPLQVFINLHMPILTWWMCVFGEMKLDQHFIVEYSFLGQEPWKFICTLSDCEEDPLSSINARTQTKLLFLSLTDMIRTDQEVLGTWAEPCHWAGSTWAGASCSLSQDSRCSSLLLALIKLNTCWNY